jgi:hypothetical protein
LDGFGRRPRVYPEQMGEATRRARALGLTLVLASVALACVSGLEGAFVWDDIPLIVDSDRLFDARNLTHILWVDTMHAADGGKFQASAGLDTYRPVTVATFFLDAWLWRRNPFGYHLDNLLAHLACVALVYLWSLRLLGAQHWRRALWAAAFFGLHPLLGEAHLWINGRSDVYCTLFALAGALLWSADDFCTTRALRLVTAGVLFLVALLSKESVAPFLLVLLLWDAGLLAPFARERAVAVRARLLRALPILGALAAYTALRLAALSGLHTDAGGAQLWLALQRLPLLLLDGLASTLAPRQVMPRYLNEEYGRLAASASLLAWLALGLGALLLFARRRRAPLAVLGLAGFAATLAPAALIATLTWYGFGRYLYLPIALLAPALADAGARGLDLLQARSARLARAASVAYLALLGLRLWASTAYWDGPRAFYESIIAEDPQASHGHGGLGKYLLEQGEGSHAIHELRLAVRLAPRDSRYLNNLGVAYLRSGRAADARRIAELGLARFPQHAAKFERLRALSAGDGP